MGHAVNDDLVTYPNDQQFGKASPGKVGMWIFLATDGMSFSGLLIAYGILRAQAQSLGNWLIQSRRWAALFSLAL